MLNKQSLRAILVTQQTQIFEFCLGCFAYSFRTLLVVYLIHKLSLPLANSYTILAIYFGSAGILECIALSLINKLYDYFFAILEGFFLNLLGIVFLFFASKQVIFAVYLALSLITIGNVLLVSGVFILSSKIAKQENRRMIFTKNYVFLNLGSIAGIFISGGVYSTFGIKIALISVFFLIIFAIINFITFFAEEIKGRAKITIVKNIAIQLGIIITILFLSSFYFLNISFQWGEIISWVGIVIFMATQFKNIQAQIIGINLICILFFISFAQLNGSIILLINHYVGNGISGIKVPSQWLLTLEPIFVILFFFLCKVWPVISDSLENCSSFKKLFIAMLFLAIAFFVLGAFSYFNESDKVSLFGLVLFYFFVSLSEFIFIPTCYNYLAQTIPYSMMGVGFGYFFISRSLGNYLSMILSKTVFELSATSVELKRYVYLFAILACINIISALVLFLIKINPGLQISKLVNVVQKIP